MVRQVNGEYDCKQMHLALLKTQVKDSLINNPTYTLRHIPGVTNKADDLVRRKKQFKEVI
jgi:hypothetical protein